MPDRPYLFRDEHVPLKAALPAIDAHNHLWGNFHTEAIVQTMDAVGVACYCDATANARIAWEGGGYTLAGGSFDDFLAACPRRHPGRFYGFTMAGFARGPSRPLFTDARAFVEECVATLRRHVALGARGLKITKELGLHYRDGAGRLLTADDERLAPIFDEAGRLGVPVLIHQSDPYGFFLPATPDNEHYDALQKYPAWSFADAKYPRKVDLLGRRDRLVRNHPGTTFLLPHVANFPENLPYVSALLAENPNVYIDLSARIDELGRQPYSARGFLLRWQDRVLFGTDMPADLPTSVWMYRCYFRFLQTFDEYFFPPDYDASGERRRWAIYGVGLPRTALAKIYFRNALRIVPGLRKDYTAACKALQGAGAAAGAKPPGRQTP